MHEDNTAKQNLSAYQRLAAVDGKYCYRNNFNSFIFKNVRNKYLTSTTHVEVTKGQLDIPSKKKRKT